MVGEAAAVRGNRVDGGYRRFYDLSGAGTTWIALAAAIVMGVLVLTIQYWMGPTLT